MKYLFPLFFFFVTLIPSLYSCNGYSGKASLLQENNNDSQIQIIRFDSDLYNFLKTNGDSENEDSLKSKYQDFLRAFGSVAINNSDYNDPSFFKSLKTYFSNETLLKIYKDEQVTFQNIESLEKQLSSANNLIRQYFEGKELPTLSMHVSGFKANTIMLQNLISISADKYLGSEYSGYNDFFEDYVRIQMKPEIMVRDFLKAWIISELPASNKRKDLLSEMINQGKILYSLQLLLPDWSEADLIGYTGEQLKWSENNEKEIWKKTLTNNYLFSTDHMTIIKYMDEAPYTSLISPESPGRLGAWIGWQIIKKYAENTKSDITSIMKENDCQNILKASKYNP